MNKDMSLDYFVVPIFITVLVLLYYLRSRNAFSSKTVPKDEIRGSSGLTQVKPRGATNSKGKLQRLFTQR